MNALTQRVSAGAGIALAAAAALWWLGSTRLALDRGGDSARAAAEALYALLCIRAMALAVLSVRAGALTGWRDGVATGLSLIAPSWPIVLLAWSASTVTGSRVALAEALLALAAVALPLVGLALRRLLGQLEHVLGAASAVAVALATGIWLSHLLWLRVLA
jgi:hypothetical protein